MLNQRSFFSEKYLECSSVLLDLPDEDLRGHRGEGAATAAAASDADSLLNLSIGSSLQMELSPDLKKESDLEGENFEQRQQQQQQQQQDCQSSSSPTDVAPSPPNDSTTAANSLLNPYYSCRSFVTQNSGEQQQFLSASSTIPNAVGPEMIENGEENENEEGKGGKERRTMTQKQKS